MRRQVRSAFSKDGTFGIKEFRVTNVEQESSLVRPRVVIESRE